MPERSINGPYFLNLRCSTSRLSDEPERCKRRRAGAALGWYNRETEMSDLKEIEPLFFVLVGDSPRLTLYS